MGLGIFAQYEGLFVTTLLPLFAAVALLGDPHEATNASSEPIALAREYTDGPEIGRSVSALKERWHAHACHFHLDRPVGRLYDSS